MASMHTFVLCAVLICILTHICLTGSNIHILDIKKRMSSVRQADVSESESDQSRLTARGSFHSFPQNPPYAAHSTAARPSPVLHTVVLVVSASLTEVTALRVVEFSLCPLHTTLKRGLELSPTKPSDALRAIIC